MDQAYSRYGEEHDDKLFLTEDGMLDEGIGEADETSAAFFEERG